MRNRYFFPAVIGAILVVLVIMGVILLVQGDEEDQGRNTKPSPSPDSAPRLTLVHETSVMGSSASA